MSSDTIVLVTKTGEQLALNNRQKAVLIAVERQFAESLNAELERREQWAREEKERRRKVMDALIADFEEDVVRELSHKEVINAEEVERARRLAEEKKGMVTGVLPTDVQEQFMSTVHRFVD